MTFWTTEMEKDCTGRGRIEVSLRGHCCSPYCHRTTPRDSFPGPTVSPVGKDSKIDIVLPSALDTLPGRLTWILHCGESLWASVGLDHWGSERGGEKVQSDLGGSHSCLYQCPCGSTCPPAEPRQWSLLAVKSFLWLYPGREANLQPIPTTEHSL